VMKAMFMSKLKVALAVLLALASLGTVVKIAQVQAAGLNPEQNAASGLPAVAADGNQQALNEGGLYQQVQQSTWFVAKVDSTSNTLMLQMHPPTRAFFFAGGTAVDNKQVSGFKVVTKENGGGAILPPA